MAVTIKRYPNRKLYDTVSKQYITLEGIADLIRGGEEVVVVDHATGEDLTAVTLTQIIFEQEKKQTGFLPRPLLTGLVKAGGNTLEAVRKSLAAPLELLGHVNEEIERRLNVLVKRGELAQDEANQLLEKLRNASSMPLTEKIDERLEETLKARGVPTRSDLRNLLDQLDELTAKVDELSDSNT